MCRVEKPSVNFDRAGQSNEARGAEEFFQIGTTFFISHLEARFFIG
jgi:hypothetical protein